MSMHWGMICDALQSSLPPPTADGPGVIPSFPLACFCLPQPNALPHISMHRITNVINFQWDLTMAETAQQREPGNRHTKNKKATKRVNGQGDLKMMTAAGEKKKNLRWETEERADKKSEEVKKWAFSGVPQS